MSHLEWHKIFGYFLVNHVINGIHYKINFNVVIGDIESIHDTFGVSWNMPKTWFIWQVCFGEETGKKKFKMWWEILRANILLWVPKTWVFCFSTRHQTSLPHMRNQMLEVCCSLCSHKHQEGKVGFLLGRKSIFISFCFLSKRGGMESIKSFLSFLNIVA